MADGGRFFDDISTYLPDLLYNPNRFTTVQEVLRYVQRQARYHMNRFDRARTMHVRRRTRSPTPTPAHAEEHDGNALLRAMMGGLFNTTPMTFISAELSGEPFSELSSVIVRPTQAQIDAASELIVASEAEGNCAICQEALQATTSPIRRIRHCNHCFHRNCIDVWFTSHVQCPVCRHDIRE
jgi:hypothetical protein